MRRSQPVFVLIATTAYSGATLLSFLLNTHSQIATVGEMDGLIPGEDPELYLCSCGQKIKECEFWQSVKIAMSHRGFEFDVAHFDTKFILAGPRFIQRLRVGSFRNNILDSTRDMIFQTWPKERCQLKALVARNEAFIKSVLEVTGKNIFVDTSKDRLRLRSLYKFSNLDIRVIHLVRDARGVVTSWLRRGRVDDISNAARDWVKSHHKLEIAIKSLPAEKNLRVYYEDLCQDTENTLDKIYEFCGVEFGGSITDFGMVPHHIVGNPIRLGNLSEVSLDERWKSVLTKEQLKKINQVAGSMQRQYGYL